MEEVSPTPTTKKIKKDSFEDIPEMVITEVTQSENPEKIKTDKQFPIPPRRGSRKFSLQLQLNKLFDRRKSSPNIQEIRRHSNLENWPPSTAKNRRGSNFELLYDATGL
jgi:hypothetical protein